MATTNLISKSLGDILTESGNGIPDHISPKGSLYTDIDTGSLYQNLDGSTTWIKYITVAYIEGYYQDNTTATTINATNTWTSVGNNFTEGQAVGFTASADTLVLSSGYDGTYEIRGDVTLSHVAGTSDYEVGLSVNGANPAAGTYGGSRINATYIRQHVGFETTVSLVGSDTIELAVRNITNTNNIIIRHAQLYARKID